MENIQSINQGDTKERSRLVSIDAFRGATIAGMILVINPGSWKYIYAPLRHADWNGCTPTDLIYPFFLFIVGVSITFSFSKSLSLNIPQKQLYFKILKRTVILFLLGLFLNTFPNFNFSDIRIMGVLQRIAVCYFIVSIIFMNTDFKYQVAITVLLLLVYWALMEWIPVPGIGAGHYDKVNNFATYFDRFFLQGHMGSYEKIGEPEGLISTLPSLSTTLFGVLTGHLLKYDIVPREKLIIIFATGAALVFAGIMWGFYLPVNKHLWTSSYSVLTVGYGLIVFGVFYYLIDVKRYNKWFKPFLVFGMNAIVVYVLSIVVAQTIRLITFTTSEGVHHDLKTWLYEKFFAPQIGNYNGSLLYAIIYCLIWTAVMWYFYKKKIFIRI
ncbi:MAG: DUF5009 domain-containing protein [Ignavibacteriales bacterium]|nr:MAG: DUF5009 domain-containing protein [Ignavibacteriales bacterium]